jgi:uncharacterized delta-60 repeat protein
VRLIQKLVPFCCCLSLYLFAWSANADDGVPDSFFATGVSAKPVRAVAVQADGRILLGGMFTDISGFPTRSVARLNPDGTMDKDFYAAISGSTPAVHAIAVQPDGKILIGGVFSSVDGTERGNLARLNSDGSLDREFSASGLGANGKVSALALQPDGKVLLAGNFTRVAGIARGYVARLNADGSLDKTFGEHLGANWFVSDIALQPDGKVLVCGNFTKFNSSKPNRARIARVNSDGSLDGSFAEGFGGANGDVVSLALRPDGKILIGGVFSSVDRTTRSNVARLNPNGSIDPVFASGLAGADGEVSAMLPLGDGKVLIGGQFTAINLATMGRIARLDEEGRVDASFGEDPRADSYVAALSRQSDGKILVVGDFTSMRSVPRQRVARLGSGSLPPDTQRPSIALLGDNPMTVAFGSVFSDRGALVTDDVDSPRTIQGTGLVDTSTPGSYTRVYSAADAAGNTAVPVNRTVIVVPSGDDVWDFTYEMRHVGESAADAYLHSSVNARKYSEWQSSPVTYWGPTQNGTEAQATFRFPFGGNAERISVRAELASFNFDWGRQNGWSGSGTGSSSLWASRDGQSWTLIKDNPTPATWVDSYVSFDGDLPASLLGGREIWLQVRMTVQGALNSSYTTAQFARSSAANLQPVFAVRAKYAKADSDILQIQPSDSSLNGATTLDIGSYVLESFGKTFQPGPFTGRGLFIPAKGQLPIKVAGFSHAPESVQAYLPVTETDPVEFDFGPSGVRAFAFQAGGPILTAILDPSRIFPTYVLTAVSDRGVTCRFFGTGGMAIRAERGSIRKISISASYARTLAAGVSPGGMQLAPVTTSLLNEIEGGISSVSAVPLTLSQAVQPRISLVGENVMTVSLGSAFADPGAVLQDESDPDKKVYATGSVNTASVGSYTLTYEGADSSRAAAIPVSRVVNVVGQPAPSIISVGVRPHRVTIPAGASPRKVTILIANNTTGTVQDVLRVESGSSSVVVPDEIPFSARGKSRDVSPPRTSRVELPISALTGKSGETTVTVRYGGMMVRFTVVVK